MKWNFVNPQTKEPFQVIAGDKVPEPLVRAYAKQHAPPPRRSPLEQMPIVSMPTPFEFSDASVWSSPKGFLGPGVIANAMSKLMADPTWQSQQGPVTPDVVYKEGNKGLIETGQLAAMPLLPASAVSTLLRRLGTQGAISAGGEVLAGGSPEKVVEHGLGGAGAQGLIEGILGISKLPVVAKVAKKMLGQHAATVERISKQNAQNAADLIRNAESKALVQKMDEGNIAQDAAALMAKHAEQITKTEAGNATLSKTHAAVEEAQKQAHRSALLQWADQVAKQSAQHAAAMAQHAEQGAAEIMEEAKRVVPWWQELTSDGKGLIDAVIGKGQKLLSDGYDAAMKAAIETARGTKLLIPQLDAKRLGVKVTPPSVREVLKGSSRDATQVPPTQMGEAIDGVQVDAGDLIGAVTRMTKKSPEQWDLYHRTLDTLHSAPGDLGIDPAAREAYKIGSGVIKGMDANKIIKFDDATKQLVLDPDALVAGMTAVDRMNIFRQRGMGDVNTSPYLQAFANSPPVPAEIPKPMAPLELPKPELAPMPAKPELPTVPERGPLNPGGRLVPLETPLPEAPTFGEIKLPGDSYSRGAVLGGAFGLLGGLLGGHAGGPVGIGAGAPSGGALGYGLGRLLPKEIKTTVPIAGVEDLIRAILLGGGTAARQEMVTPSGANTDVTAADLAEIRAAQAAGQTAADNEALQLQVAPSDETTR